MPLLRKRRTEELRPGAFTTGWEVPGHFNFTRDVIDALARRPDARGADLRRRRGDRRPAVVRRDLRRRGALGAPPAHTARSRRPGARPARQEPGLALRDARRPQGRPRRRPVPGHAPRARHRVPRPPLRRAARDRRALVRDRGRGDAEPGRGQRRRPLPRRGQERARALHARGADRGHDCRRDRAHPLHLGDDEGAEGRRPHPRLHVGEADAGEPLARRPRAGRRLVHGRHRLGEVGLERPPGTVVVRRRDRPPRGAVRARAAPLAPGEARRHGALPGADGVPAAREARLAREDLPSPPPPRRLGRRAAQPGGDRALPERARPDDLRRVRADGEHAARREHARHADPPGLDGPADAGPRHRRDRRAGARLRARRGGRPRADRAAADALHRLLGGTGGHERGVPRQLVRHGRPGRPGRGGLPLVRGTRRRRDPLCGVPDRAVRGRERAARAPRRRRERRRRRPRRGPRPDREGVRRAPSGSRGRATRWRPSCSPM